MEELVSLTRSLSSLSSPSDGLARHVLFILKSESIFNGLLEEMIWKISVHEHKRARKFHAFAAELEQNASDRKNLDKNNSDTVHDCPVCGREVSAARFAPHLSKCLGIGGRSSQTVKKGVSESETITKGNSHPPLDARSRQGGNLKRRGRPPKRPPAVSLTHAENDALLSHAISNATQRLHLQGISVSASSSIKSGPSVPHPLSQSHVANPPVTKVRRKKKKENPGRHRSRNSSQASSSSDSEEEVEEGEDLEDYGPEAEEAEDEGEDLESYQRSCTPAGRPDDQKGSIDQRRASENLSISPASIVPPTSANLETLPRPVFKRRSSSQADSSDGSDSD